MHFEHYLHPRTVQFIKEKYSMTGADLKFFYYGTREITIDNKARLTDLVGDVYFVEGTHRTVRTQILKSTAPTYFYRYAYDQGFSVIKKFTRSHISGEC